MGWNTTHLTDDHRTRAEIAATTQRAALASGLNDDSDVTSTGGSAHFATYQMRSLRLGTPAPSFAATVRGGLRGGIRRGTR